MTPHRAFLEHLYDVAVAAAHPRAVVDASVAQLRAHHPQLRRIAIIALGKAAPTMAEAAVARVRESGATIAGGAVIGVDDGPVVHPGIPRVSGDHPVPGPRSQAAADLLGRAVGDARSHADAALVLISGGATSLVAAPVDGIDDGTLAALYTTLLRSGWDIEAMNTVRKRFLRWGAGRLAAALAPMVVQPAILSDVIGDDPRVIASGPCSPDPTSATDVLRRLETLPSDNAPLVATLAQYLERVMRGEIDETPKPDDAVFDGVEPAEIRGNGAAVAAAADHARRAGWTVRIVPVPLRGEARDRGRDIARELLAADPRGRLCWIHSGETTVTIPAPAHHGEGGRCQELALAAARLLARPGDGDPPHAASISLLAAGTDGRDGPSDAAGAIVDRDTWRTAAANDGAPDEALATHDSHRALAAAGALLPARATGTNVMDIVIGLVSER